MSGSSSECGGATAMAPSVAVYVPAVHLQGYITFYYFVRASGPLADFLYPEWGNVRFVLSGEWRVDMEGCYSDAPQIDVLYGPTDRCGAVMASGGRMVGFGMTPLGWHRLIGGDASAMANRVRPLLEELGVAGHALREALLKDEDDEAGVVRFDALLTGLLRRQPLADPLIVLADEALRARPADVPAFAAAIGISRRSLHRLCLRAFGFPPKRLLRRQRFLDTLGLVRSAVGQPLSSALDLAYHDQPHFYRDFHDFMGMSPRQYFTASRELMARAAAAQVAADVTLSFRLPPQPTRIAA